VTTDHNRATRRAVLGGSAAALATGLAGCTGDGGTQFAESDPLVTHQRVGRGGERIEYWTSKFYSPSEAESSQPAAAPAIRAQHEAWAEAHPEYRIDLSYQAFDQWKSSLLTRASEGDAPPGSTLDSFWVPDFYSYLQPLNDYVDDVDDFFPFVRETATRDGDLLAAWKYTDCRCLYYRQDLVDRYGDGEAPRTWDDLVNVGGAIAEGEDIAGFMLLTEPFVNLPFFWGQGGELVDDEGTPVLGRDPNRQAMERTLAFVRRLVDEGVTPKRTANFEEYEAIAREARNDQIGMFVGGNWQIAKDFKNAVDDDSWRRWQVAPIPMREADQFATGVGGWTEGAFAQGDDGRAAALKDFVARHVDREAMGRYCEAAGLLPTRASVFDSEYYADDTFPYQSRFREFLEHGVARPAFPIYSTIATEFQNAIQAVITDQASPAAATDRLLSNVDAEYDG
jgi:multiple sugar transport system substrate-binding protein